MYNSFSFLAVQAFFIAIAAAETLMLFTLRADCGHFTTQRIHEIHLLLSVNFKFSVLIAFAGHCLAHRPQPMQFLFVLGVKPMMLVSL